MICPGASKNYPNRITDFLTADMPGKRSNKVHHHYVPYYNVHLKTDDQLNGIMSTHLALCLNDQTMREWVVRAQHWKTIDGDYRNGLPNGPDIIMSNALDEKSDRTPTSSPYGWVVSKKGTGDFLMLTGDFWAFYETDGTFLQKSHGSNSRRLPYNVTHYIQSAMDKPVEPKKIQSDEFDVWTENAMRLYEHSRATLRSFLNQNKRDLRSLKNLFDEHDRHLVYPALSLKN
jgi:hypothetical protein